MIQFAGDRMSVKFERFDLSTYQLFLRCKTLPEYQVVYDRTAGLYTINAPARFAAMLGAEIPATGHAPLSLPAFLLDDQRLLVARAFEAKRFALWCQCGWGKTLAGLEFARQVVNATAGRVLIVTLNQVVPEWVDEAAKWYGDSLQLHRIESRQAMREWCERGKSGIAVVNYEKFNPDEIGQEVNECRRLAGVVLDEASRLKAGGGKQKWAIIKSFKGVEYKLALTATPAPNDVMEFASQASFLEKFRSEGEILWTYFTRNPKTNEWEVKPHALKAFYEFMSSWSIYVNNPKLYGWRLNQPDVPKPVYQTIPIEPTMEQIEAARRIATSDNGQMNLFATDSPNAIQRQKLSQVAKGFEYVRGLPAGQRYERIPSRKPSVVSGIVKGEIAQGAKVLVWTEFDGESELLAEAMADFPGVETLTGRVKKSDRPAMIDRFRHGSTNVLITRSKLIGFGVNLQAASAMVFSGWTDSFESMFQSIRRAYRHGQTQAVRVYFPVVDQLESDTLANIQRKEREFEKSISEMESSYINAVVMGGFR